MTSPSGSALPWPLPERLDLRDHLLAAYGTDRGYHDVRHLSEVLARVVELGYGDDPAVLLAAWFHDAVYDGAADDEERSARWAEEALADDDTVDGAEVARLVRLTATHGPASDDVRAQVLCDADLAILGADAARYAEYVADVRRDFAHLDDATFTTGRIAVLADLLARPRLFGTEQGRRRWEDAARRNLREELSALR
ncbi:MAG: HD domain-containing protein [Marmoricola sp.]